MTQKTIIITGAGASYDVIDFERASPGWVDGPKRSLRPPLLKEIFNLGWENFFPIIGKYPLVGNLLSSLSIGLNNSNNNLEELISREYLKSSRKIQFQQFIAFLQELFDTISNNYYQTPSNYSAIVDTFYHDDRDASYTFINFNYDILLDKSIQSTIGQEFRSFNDYISNNKIKLIHIHGAINWGYQILNSDFTIHNNKIIDQFNNNLRLGNLQIMEFDSRGNAHKRYDSEKKTLIFPALVIPAADTKESHICPETHISEMSNSINKCTNIICIGWKAGDRFLVNELRNANVCSKLIIIGNSEAGVNQTEEILLSVLPNKQIVKKYTNGFNKFILENELLDVLYQ